MTKLKTSINRPSFLKTTALAEGGMRIGFNWLLYSKSSEVAPEDIPEEWYNLNAYIKIGEDGVVSIMAPNPEFGHNVNTSLPMIVADELDIDWEQVVVEQAPFNTGLYVRQGWNALRTDGAAARQLLVNAAAAAWNVPASEITTKMRTKNHPSGKKATFGEMASAASKLKVPGTVENCITDLQVLETL